MSGKHYCILLAAFGDRDGDGDLDLFVGFEGGMQMFEHDGSPQTANRIEETSNFTAIAHYWNSISNPAPHTTAPSITNLLGTTVPNATAISIADVNNDGIPDILISDDSGSIWEF